MRLNFRKLPSNPIFLFIVAAVLILAGSQFFADSSPRTDIVAAAPIVAQSDPNYTQLEKSRAKAWASRESPSDQESATVAAADPRLHQMKGHLADAKGALAGQNWEAALVHLQELEKLQAYLTVTATKEVRAGFYTAYFGQGISASDKEDSGQAGKAFESAQSHATGADLTAVRTELTLVQKYAEGVKAYDAYKWSEAASAFGTVASTRPNYLKVAEKLKATNFNLNYQNGKETEDKAGDIPGWKEAKGWYEKALAILPRREPAFGGLNRVVRLITAEENRLALANRPPAPAPAPAPVTAPSRTQVPAPAPKPQPTAMPTPIPTPTPTPRIPILVPANERVWREWLATNGAYTAVAIPPNAVELTGGLRDLAKPPQSASLIQAGPAGEFEDKFLAEGRKMEYRFLFAGERIEIETKGIKVLPAYVENGEPALLLIFNGQTFWTRGQKIALLGVDKNYVGYLNDKGLWYGLVFK